MTFQIFKSRLFAIAFCLMACVSTNAQESSQMQALIGKSLSKLQAATPEAFLNCIAEMNVPRFHPAKVSDGFAKPQLLGDES